MKRLMPLAVLITALVSTGAQASCQDVQLDTFRRMKGYFGWREASCSNRDCIQVAFGSRQQRLKVLEVLPEEFELQGCLIQIIFWDPAHESGVTFHN